MFALRVAYQDKDHARVINLHWIIARVGEANASRMPRNGSPQLYNLRGADGATATHTQARVDVRNIIIARIPNIKVQWTYVALVFVLNCDRAAGSENVAWIFI